MGGSTSMYQYRYALWLVAALSVASAPLAAQKVMSAQSGTIHHTEGRVLVDEQKVQAKTYGPFSQLKEGQVLTTEDGKAELLLNPGVFLRLGEKSGVKMISNKLVDTRLQVEKGDVLLEVAELGKDNSVTLLYHDLSVKATKAGIYRFDTEANLFRVYAGEADVESPAGAEKVKSGRELQLAGSQVKLAKFDKKESDAFMDWNQGRDGIISVASVSTAKGFNRSGFAPTGSAWYYDPVFGMYGYVPYRGYFASPFGYMYYSPRYVGYYQYGYGGYNNGYGANNGGGYGGTGVGQPSRAPSLPDGRMSNSAPSGGYNGGGFSGTGGSSGGMSAPSASAGASTNAGAAAGGGGGAHRGH